MKRYIRLRLWDYILCTLAAAGLVKNIYNGYEMTDALSGNLPVILLLMAILQGILFLFCYNKKSKRIGLVVLIAAAAGIIAYMAITHPFLDEKNTSMQIFWVLLLAVAAGSYLITRTRVGTFAFVAAGNFVVAGAVFLEFGLSLGGYLMFLLASVAMILLRVYMMSMGMVQTGKVQMNRYVIQIGMTCAAAFAVAVLIFVFVILPLKPPTYELKLIQQFKSMDVIHQVGVSSLLPELDPDKVSSGDAVKDEETTEDPTDDENQETENVDQDKEKENEISMKAPKVEEDKQEENSTNKDKEIEAQAISYEHRNLTWIILLCAAVAAVILSVFGKKYQRRKRYQAICHLPRKEGVIECYRLIERILYKIKIRKADHLTIAEFARNSRKYTEAFVYNEGGFEALTKIYSKAYYGNADISEEEWQLFADAYEELYDNILDELGKWKYIWLFYRI